MTKEEFDSLKPGDVIGHTDPLFSHSWIVSANYGDRVTLVATADAVNPAEWEIVWTKEARD
jgi:hypothetical protein